MKKIITALSLFLILAVLSIGIYAQGENDSHSWYCIRMKDHARPPLPKDLEFIKENDGFYIGKDEKVIYLTFDAGYENGNVERILDTLREENVTGAFFILSNLVEKNPELIKRMANEGHLICNHTSKHPDTSKISDIESFQNELKALEELCSEKAGISVAKYFRPPEGKFNERTLKFAKVLGYKTVFWSFAYADWDNNAQMSAEKAKEKIMSNIHNGAVLLLHPTSKTNADILGDIIAELKQQGYRFGTLEELTS